MKIIGYYIQRYPNGGGLVLHSWQEDLDKLSEEENNIFAEEFVTEVKMEGETEEEEKGEERKKKGKSWIKGGIYFLSTGLGSHRKLCNSISSLLRHILAWDVLVLLQKFIFRWLKFCGRIFLQK